MFMLYIIMGRLSYFQLYRNIILMYVLMLVLQGVGLFTPGWLTNRGWWDSCSSSGLFYRCCEDENNTVQCTYDIPSEYLNKTTLGLEAFSFALQCVVIAMLLFALLKCTRHKKDTAGNFMVLIYVGIVSCLVLISAFCSLVGCMVFSGKYFMKDIRYSYYLVVVSGIGQIISMCVSYVYLVKLW